MLKFYDNIMFNKFNKLIFDRILILTDPLLKKMLRSTLKIYKTPNSIVNGSKSQNLSVGSNFIKKQVDKLATQGYPDVYRTLDPQVFRLRQSHGHGEIVNVKDKKNKNYYLYKKRYNKFQLDRHKKSMNLVRLHAGSTMRNVAKSQVLEEAIKRMVADVAYDFLKTGDTYKVEKIVMISKFRAICILDNPYLCEWLNQKNEQNQELSMLIENYMTERLTMGKVPSVHFTNLHLSEDNLQSKFDQVEEELQQIRETENQLKINFDKERRRREELLSEGMEPEEIDNLFAESDLERSNRSSHDIDFFGIEARKMDPENKGVENLRGQMRRDGERSWRDQEKSPLYPLTGIDHNFINAKILHKYRSNRAVAGYLDEHSIASAQFRFVQHPYEKLASYTKTKDLNRQTRGQVKEIHEFVPEKDISFADRNYQLSEKYKEEDSGVGAGFGGFDDHDDDDVYLGVKKQEFQVTDHDIASDLKELKSFRPVQISAESLSIENPE